MCAFICHTRQDVSPWLRVPSPNMLYHQQARSPGPGSGPSSQQEVARSADLPSALFPPPALLSLPHCRYLLFMKLAALQLMQQKASKVETTSLENGSPSSSESKPADPLGPEAGNEEEGSSASGLAKVKELAETIASDDSTGVAVVDVGGALGLPWQLVSPGWLVVWPQAGRLAGGRETRPLPLCCVSTADPRSREVIHNACKAVGSISSTAFDIRFNPDIFSPGK